MDNRNNPPLEPSRAPFIHELMKSIAGMSHANRCLLTCTIVSMHQVSIMTASHCIPAAESDDIHVSQTKTMVQVDLQTPLERHDGTPVQKPTASALGLKRHMAMLSSHHVLRSVHPSRTFQRPAAEDARSLDCKARKGFGLCRRCHH
jgi:hypothetical protein